MLDTQELYDAYQFTRTCAASHFEVRLMELLVIADRANTEKILDVWGNKITGMATLYNLLKERGSLVEEWEDG